MLRASLLAFTVLTLAAMTWPVEARLATNRLASNGTEAAVAGAGDVRSVTLPDGTRLSAE